MNDMLQVPEKEVEVDTKTVPFGPSTALERNKTKLCQIVISKSKLRCAGTENHIRKQSETYSATKGPVKFVAGVSVILQASDPLFGVKPQKI
jgi:hypothetical protein